ncbi:MAG: hypothetical protein COW03_05420 [Cytophagales bacterium CG12_big_fil_rev_8_21_14_0_65_40_12]|nr:MAG: hypothetical protein COW03_05420 [Cytophagales bacterium CG12_big_fil_rev_8_21_14_0_65_40_12]PIW02743.1 MAG: hypothetical protein COW40_18475 [Cytophagales bacterium CG17_big_fil_post_rev_8_21_14_2_50_40_13]
MSTNKIVSSTQKPAVRIKTLTTNFCSFFFLAFFITSSLFAQDIPNPGELVQEFKEKLSLQKKLNTDTLQIYAFYLKKLVERGNYQHADTIFNQLDLKHEPINGSSELVEIYKQRAYMYKVQQRLTKSLEDYLFLKNYFEASNDQTQLAELYCLLAEYYRSILEFDLCIKHLELASDLFKINPPRPEILAFWYSRKAAWANEFYHNNDSVLVYANEGLRIVEQTNDAYTKALLLNEIGFISKGNGGSQEVILDYYTRSKDLLLENERYRDYVEVVNNMASYHYQYASITEAKRLLESIVIRSEENQWYRPLMTTYDLLAGIYRDLGEVNKSIDAREKSLIRQLNDCELINRIRVSDLAFNYEKDLARKELEVQSQKTQIAQAEASSNKTAFIISLCLALILLLIAIVSFQINLRFKRKNQLLNLQSQQIKKSNSDLERSLGEQKTLFKELNHRVKNNLSILTGLIYLQEVAEGNDNLKNTLGTLRNRIKSMALAHESLYNAEQAEKIDFQNYLNALFLELKNALSHGNKIQVQIACEGFELDLKQAVPVAMIINELFTNSIKHGYKESNDGVITVKAYHGEIFSTIKYTDDGIGFGMKDAKNRTLGLRLVSLLLEQLDAKLIDNSGEKGVSFVIEIPNS